MFESAIPQNLPERIPAFGERQVALSGETPFEPVSPVTSVSQITVTRHSRLTPAVSPDHHEELDPGQVKQLFIEEHLLAPQLAEVNEHPEHAPRRVSAAVMLLSLGRNKDAIKLLSQAPDKDADYWIRHYLAIAAARDQNHHKAELELKELIARNPDDSRPKHALGRLFLECQRVADAHKILLDACRANLTNAHVFNDCGVAAIRQGKQRDAIGLLRKALMLNPRSSLAMTNLGVCFLADGRAHKAEKFFKKALHVDPRCAPAVHDLAEIYINTGRLAETVELLEEHLDNAPVDDEAHERLAWAYFGLGQLKKARKVLEGANRRLGGRNSGVLNNLALFYSALNDVSSAEQAFAKSIEIAPDNYRARVNYAYFLAAREKWGILIKTLSEAEPFSDVRGALLLAHGFERMGEGEKALSVLDRFEAKNPGDPSIAQNRGSLLATILDRPADAVKVLSSASALHPTRPGLISNLGYALIKCCNLSAAREVLEPWISLPRSEMNVATVCVVATWGLLRIREGHFREGIEWYRKAQSIASGRLRERIRQKILVEEGRRFIAQGKRSDALAKLRKSLRKPVDEEFSREAQDLIASGASLN